MWENTTHYHVHVHAVDLNQEGVDEREALCLQVNSPRTREASVTRPASQDAAETALFSPQAAAVQNRVKESSQVQQVTPVKKDRKKMCLPLWLFTLFQI